MVRKSTTLGLCRIGADTGTVYRHTPPSYCMLCRTNFGVLSPFQFTFFIPCLKFIRCCTGTISNIHIMCALYIHALEYSYRYSMGFGMVAVRDIAPSQRAQKVVTFQGCCCRSKGKSPSSSSPNPAHVESLPTPSEPPMSKPSYVYLSPPSSFSHSSSTKE